MASLRMKTEFVENEAGDGVVLSSLSLNIINVDEDETAEGADTDSDLGNLFESALATVRRATGSAAPAPAPAPDPAPAPAPAPAPVRAPGPEPDPADRFASFGTRRVRDANAKALYDALVEAAKEGYDIPQRQIERLPKRDIKALGKELEELEAPGDEPEAPGDEPEAPGAVGHAPCDKPDPAPDPMEDFFGEDTPDPAPDPAPAEEEATVSKEGAGAEAPFEDWSDADLQDLLRSKAERLGGASQIMTLIERYKNGGGASTIPMEDRPAFVAELRAL